ncbi:hypothetical protein EAO27_02015 [Sphingopyxis sp. YF1]|uniref:hypothetical protein n=1 Tax=Sphingopyxis sp. YF1 TaxID=2482763 RepID=UPI001F61FCCD|nr:hypothetical protein [Sphingopyxis sp. YF1]UNU41618.1 hypothetical protein EAO27_02015 [Sphingopyxis sp. YF1]
MSLENWITTDEAEDVAGSLRQARRAFNSTATDAQSWKWVTLAMHSAIQGACVCHLTTTASPIGAVTKSNASEWISYFEKSRTDPKAIPPRTHLMALPALLKAVRRANSAGDRSNDVGVMISDDELRWLCRLHDDVRNQFTHFAPMSWALETSGIPDLGKLIARIIGEISNMGWGFRHKNLAWREELQNELSLLSEGYRPSQ